MTRDEIREIVKQEVALYALAQCGAMTIAAKQYVGGAPGPEVAPETSPPEDLAPGQRPQTQVTTADLKEPTPPEAEAGEGAPTKDDCRKALLELAEQKGKETCKKVLDAFDAKNLSGVPEDAYADFIANVKAELADD